MQGVKKQNLPQKICLTCGKPFTWRKKWEKVWEEVKILFRKMPEQQNPLILTLKLDTESQLYFDSLRERFFPPERNFLKAHLTLFHQLPDTMATREFLDGLSIAPFSLRVSGLRHLGAGVAFTVDSPELQRLHAKCRQYFEPALIPQDRQPYRPHITIQNKVSPEASRKLRMLLDNTFEPFTIQGLGLELWEYLGGPWRHDGAYLFKSAPKL